MGISFFFFAIETLAICKTYSQKNNYFWNLIATSKKEKVKKVFFFATQLFIKENKNANIKMRMKFDSIWSIFAGFDHAREKMRKKESKRDGEKEAKVIVKSI